MCLTIPGQVVSVDRADPSAPTAVVVFEGRPRSVSLLFLPEVREGEFVLVQAGIAITRVPAEEAERALGMARRPLPAAEAPEAVP